MDIVSISNAEHYIWGELCDGWHFLKTDELSVIRERIPAGKGEMYHVHEKSQQFFFILSGEAEFLLDGKTLRAKAGEGVHIKPGMPHKISNRLAEDLEFVVVSQPKSHGDRANL